MKISAGYFKITLVLLFVGCSSKTLNQTPFPSDFQFGCATASYQVEGAWNESGKGENIWDYLTHNNPSHIVDESNGDIACNSYYKYKEDVQLLKDLGVSFYRFSLSWSRILPTGYPNYINQDGIQYYNNLINELLANDIEPMVTIFHWDLPQPLQEIGGWPNPVLARHFVNFAKIVFENFGDRVKQWITINEPMQICKMGYGDNNLAPAYSSSGMADYMCTYTVTRAHTLAYRLYKDSFKETQKGEIGYTIHSYWFEPNTNTTEDIEAAERAFEFYTGIFANPIFGNGDWPNVVKEYVADMSAAQNFSSSRLPEFSENDIEENQGTADFFGLNYYTAAYVQATDQITYPVNWNYDGRFEFWSETAVEDEIGPQGLRKVMNKLREMYGNISIIITENGKGTVDTVDDYDRANYYLTYLEACLEAIYEDNITLKGYTAWSLMDNFEWAKGYTVRFGIHQVDFENSTRPRIRKVSGDTYENVVKERKLLEETLEEPDSAIINKPTMLLILFIIIIQIYI